MLNGLLKTGLFLFLGMWIKPRFKGLISLSITVLLIWILHNEYIAYLTLQEDFSSARMSYLFKWSSITALALVYYLAIERRIATKVGSAQRAENTRGHKSDSENSEADDGFDFLRAKKTLKSKSDKILEG
jgi:hypothetical protein